MILLKILKIKKKILNNQDNEYLRSIDYLNNLNRDKNKNNNYDQLEYEKKHSNTFRINREPSFVGDINYSRHIVYPDNYDPYFEYLSDKNINAINTIVSKKKTIVNIDSNNRDKITTNNVTSYITLNNNSLAFTNNSNTFKIYLNDARSQFNANDKIIIRGLQQYTISYTSLNFFFKNEEDYVILDLKPNFDFALPYYDVLISISNVTYNGTNQYNNIPLSLINQTQIVTLYNYNNDIRLRFNIPIIYYTNNDNDDILSSACTISFYNLGNYPISLINANYPLDQYNLVGYQLIKNVTNDYIEVGLTSTISITPSTKLQGNWYNNVFYTGGSSIQIGKVDSINDGYLTPSNYTFSLDKSINNVASIKMISSEIPNIKKNIKSINENEINLTSENNKFYWENLLDSSIYSITLDTGFYTPIKLSSTMETLISTTLRDLDSVNSNSLTPYNNITITFNSTNNIATFTSLNTYILPQSLYSINQKTLPQSSYSNSYFILIQHKNHNLRTGDRIYIQNSTNFEYISADDINRSEGYLVYEVTNKDYYTINLININIIENPLPSTYGGYAITISTPNSFRIRFDYPDTFGNLIGFNYVGSNFAITPYCSLSNEYTITNKQPYVYDITKILVYNNSTSLSNTINDFNLIGDRYILLQCENFNNCTNPNGVSYFYKLQLDSNYDTILLNKFVDAPVYLNPPIRSISELHFNFVDPKGNRYNFYNINHSFTLEITSFDNYPENSYINTSTSRI